MSSAPSNAQVNRIDIIRPDAPSLAAYGDYDIGVRTLTLVDPGRVDILNTQAGAEAAIYDRKLTVEVWYPGKLETGQSRGGRISSDYPQPGDHCDTFRAGGARYST